MSDTPPSTDHEPTLYAWCGGLPALTRMTTIFYGRYVPQDPLLGPIFAGMAPDHPERVAAWLGETFGGPKIYTEAYGGYPHMVSEHLGKALTEAQRARWVALLCQSADDAGLPADPEFRSAFVSYIEWGSRIALQNSQPGARPPQGLPVPRWDWGTAGPPGSRISAFAYQTDPEPPAATPPAPEEPLSFARHIQPLFRPMDRQSMRRAFDLWSHDDVARHAESILQRVADGTMPCDHVWPADDVATLQRWIASGMPA
ncbi:MAG: group II truncated hemoglobin [Thermomicrobiales bacterium]